MDRVLSFNPPNNVEHKKLFAIFDKAISDNSKIRPGNIKEIVDDIRGLKPKSSPKVHDDIVPGGGDLDDDFFGGSAPDPPAGFF